MPEENPNLDIPLEEEKISGTDGKSELSLEEIETEIARRDEERKFEDKKDKDPNTLDPLEIDPKDKPPVEEVIETQPDPRFKDKTVEELQKMYLNVEKLQKTQTDELGTLRKENKNFKDLELKNKSLNLKEIEKKIMPEVLSWTPEERTEWFKLFNNEPEKAIAQVVNKVVEPVVETIATTNNEREVDRLTKLHKNDVVPYVVKHIDALIAANEGWWEQYGTRIFEHAYETFRNSNFDKYAVVRQEKTKTKESEETVVEDDIKNQTFVEGQKPTKIIQGKKELTIEQIRDAEPDESMTAIEKELLRRGVKVDK